MQTLSRCIALAFFVASGWSAGGALAGALDPMSLLESGGSVVVGREVPVDRIEALVEAGKARTSVRTQGLPEDLATRVLERGSRIEIDSWWTFDQVLRLCKLGGSRVTVHPKGHERFHLRHFASLGATIAGQASDRETFGEWWELLRAGGGIRPSANLAEKNHEVAELAFFGDERTTVRARGLTPDKVAKILALTKARVELDSSFGADRVGCLCSAYGDRVTVKAAGFADQTLSQFAAMGAVIDFPAGRDDVRAAQFDRVHGAAVR